MKGFYSGCFLERDKIHQRINVGQRSRPYQWSQGEDGRSEIGRVGSGVREKMGGVR